MEKELQELGQKLVDKLKDGIKERKLVSSGRLLNSVRYVINNNRVEIIANEYIYTLVKGGRRPGGGGFFSEMLSWVQSKPSVVPQGMTPASFAYAAMVKISKEGNTMFRKGSTPTNDGNLLEVLKDDTLVDELGTKLAEQMFNDLKDKIK